MQRWMSTVLVTDTVRNAIDLGIMYRWQPTAVRPHPTDLTSVAVQGMGESGKSCAGHREIT